jgi:hypothetical protein
MLLPITFSLCCLRHELSSCGSRSHLKLGCLIIFLLICIYSICNGDEGVLQSVLCYFKVSRFCFQLQYSYICEKLKHAYTGTLFCKTTYTVYGVPWFVDCDFICIHSQKPIFWSRSRKTRIRPYGSIMLVTQHPLSAKVGIDFTDKRQSFGRYGSLETKATKFVCLFFFVFFVCLFVCLYMIYSMWRQVKIPPLKTHESQKPMRRKPGAWGYSWVTLYWGT